MSKIYKYSLLILTTPEVKMAGYWPSSFVAISWTVTKFFNYWNPCPFIYLMPEKGTTCPRPFREPFITVQTKCIFGESEHMLFSKQTLPSLAIVYIYIYICSRALFEYSFWYFLKMKIVRRTSATVACCNRTRHDCTFIFSANPNPPEFPP